MTSEEIECLRQDLLSFTQKPEHNSKSLAGILESMPTPEIIEYIHSYGKTMWARAIAECNQ